MENLQTDKLAWTKGLEGGNYENRKVIREFERTVISLFNRMPLKHLFNVGRS